MSSRLRELNRRKDESLANVSHELRTPAATITIALGSDQQWIEVNVRSRVGEGSTFTVRVPRTPVSVAGSSVVAG